MNHTLINNILNHVKIQLQENRFTPVLLNMPSESDSFPKVCLQELSNIQVLKDTSGFISHSSVSIQIDIYAKAVSLDETQYSAYDVALELADAADHICSDLFAMKRTDYQPIYEKDSDVYRLTLVYSALQDDNRMMFI